MWNNYVLHFFYQVQKVTVSLSTSEFYVCKIEKSDRYIFFSKKGCFLVWKYNFFCIFHKKYPLWLRPTFLHSIWMYKKIISTGGKKCAKTRKIVFFKMFFVSSWSNGCNAAHPPVIYVAFTTVPLPPPFLGY